MKVALILGDQLTTDVSSLQHLEKHRDWIVMAEVGTEARYVAHHQQKIALIFSAMRHFAAALRENGWQVHYHHYDPTRPQLGLHDVLQAFLAHTPAGQLIVTECGEHRLHQQMLESWPAQLGIPLTIVDDSRFICTKAEFAQWAQGRKQLRMEYFYRDMRRKTGLLMDADQPVGGQWNFDSSNREPYRGDPVVPIQMPFTRDDIDKEVLSLVAREFASHPGTLTHFNWPTTREQALQALDSFINTRLRWYGDYQDAMQQSQHFMFHSLISTSLNCGLLTAVEVCQAAQQAWQDNKAPLNAVEGFIRQIIGWREFIRGIYWLTMPDYAAKNFLNNTRDLPDFYWTGETRMACMKACFKNTFDHAYAHHIQRLMVTGNFALLAGITPSQVCDWYLAVYADAYDWVELPNTLGMVMHADGGFLASKPYAASGSYIHKMSDYCRHCEYQVKTATDHNSCPFNSLYWDFVSRHADQFRKNTRMAMIYRSYERMSDDKKQALQARSAYVLEHLNEL